MRLRCLAKATQGVLNVRKHSYIEEVISPWQLIIDLITEQCFILSLISGLDSKAN